MDEEQLKKAEAAKEANTSRNNDRLKLMEQIADSSEIGRPDEIEGMEIKDEAAEAEARAAQEEKATAKVLQEGIVTEEGTEQPAADLDEKQVNGEIYYRQIVNGQEKWQTLKEIRATAQKVAAADEYLTQAAEAVRNASKLAPSVQDEPRSLEKDQTADLLRRVALGEEEAIEKLASEFERLSRRDVVQEIDQRLSLRTELAQLESDYSDVLTDPDAGELFRFRLQKMKQEAPNTPLAIAYKTIGEPLRAKYVKTDPIQDKLARKRTLVNPPSAAARQGVSVTPDDDGDVQSDIAAMAKARGFTPHIHTRRQ